MSFIFILFGDIIEVYFFFFGGGIGFFLVWFGLVGFIVLFLGFLF